MSDPVVIHKWVVVKQARRAAGREGVNVLELFELFPDGKTAEERPIQIR